MALAGSGSCLKALPLSSPVFVSPIAWDQFCEYTTTGRSGGQGSAGRQPERRLRGQDQIGAGIAGSPAKSHTTGIGIKAAKSQGSGDRVPRGFAPFIKALAVSSIPAHSLVSVV